MRQAIAALACAVVCSGAAQAAPRIDEVIAEIDAGQFRAAQADIDAALAQSDLPPAARRDYEFQRERMRRVLLDFTQTRDQVRATLREAIPDLTDAEFDAWDARGLFERRVIDGSTVYFQRAASNLFRLAPEAVARRADRTAPADGPMERANAHHAAVVAAARASGKTSVEPRRVRVTQTLTVKADAVPDGETIRAWIPYPRAIPGQQEHLRYVSSVPAAHAIAPESALQRTVALERKAHKGKATQFSVTYELSVFARHFAIDPDRVQPTPATDELAPFLAERAPHVVFTPALRLFSRQVVGDETNPWRIAQKLYAAVDQVPWAGALEYSTISNISDYALHAGHADCGQQTLLLVALLRLNGIPARWQSGMIYSDGTYNNLHDWGQLYIAPYGWIPMDVTFGRLASADPAVANFYLGGLDAYRIAFNDDWSREFVPAKTHFRSETVDLQRGEAEWRGGNLYFDTWNYDFRWQFLPPETGHGSK